MHKPHAANKSCPEGADAAVQASFDQEIVFGRRDREGLMALAEIIFPGEDVSDPRYIHWLYDLGPGGRAIEFYAKTGSIVTGHCAGIPLSYKVGNGLMPGCLAVNGMTHPDFRGRGIFFRLYGEVTGQCAKSGLRLTFGFPNSNSLNSCLRHLNYREVGSLPLWLLPLDFPRVLAAQKQGFGFFLRSLGRVGNPILRGVLSMIRPRWMPKSLKIEVTDDIGPEFDSLWEDVREDYENSLVRNRVYLQWRFAKHPTRRYRIFTARSNGKLIGYLVGTVTKVEGLSWGMIVDLLVACSREGKEAAKYLTATFLREVRAQEAAVVGCLMPRHSAGARALRRNGFIVCPARFLPRKFTVLLSWNGSGPAPEGIFHSGSWLITLADFDAL